MKSEVIWGSSRRAGVYLNVSEQLRQVEVPLFTEVRELEQEAHRVIGLIQTRQRLNRPHRVQTLQHTTSSGSSHTLTAEHNGTTHSKKTEWERWKDVFWVNVKKTTNVGYISPQKLNNRYFTYIMRPNCRTFIVFFQWQFHYNEVY